MNALQIFYWVTMDVIRASNRCSGEFPVRFVWNPIDVYAYKFLSYAIHVDSNLLSLWCSYELVRHGCHGRLLR